MEKEEWGTKRVCQSCGIKFYDFKKSPVICPACGAQFDINNLLKRKKTSDEEERSTDILNDDDIITEEDLESDDLESEEDSLEDAKD